MDAGRGEKMIAKEVKLPDISYDLSEKALAKASIENCYARTPLKHGWPQAEGYEGEDAAWCLTNVAYAPCNPIFNINMKAESADNFLDSIIAKARKRKVNLHCLITPDTKPADMGKYLTSHGFTYSGEGPCMAIDLQNIEERNNAPPGFRIMEIRDYTGLRKWCQIDLLGFGLPPYVEPSIVEWLATELNLKQPFKLFLGLLDGKPVATSMYYLGAGVAGVYNVSTLPEARNKGIGLAMTQRPLLEAKKLGYRIGVLQSSKLGLPVYQKMGFKEYGIISGYWWIYELNKGDGNGSQI
jgi:ribosomal protein S18 acetylase RimI-like enzyme